MATQAVERPAVRFAMRCWGDFALVNGDRRDVRPRGRKARALLAYLALHPEKPVSREKLAGLLWGERGEEQARASLRQTLFELKEFANGAGLLCVEREAVTLAGHALETDLDAIALLAKRGDAEGLLAAMPEPDEMLLANLDGIDPGFDDWLRVERTRRRDTLAALIADASAHALATGRTRAARALHARLSEFAPAPAPDPAGATQTKAFEPSAPVAPPVRVDRRIMIGAALLVATAGIGTAAWFGQDAGAATIDPQVRALYEPAHAIVYDRRGRQFPVAANLLKRAVAISPGYAPAVTDLAAVTAMMARTPAQWAEAERLARRAVALDPQSGLAHGVLGMTLRFESPEARRAIRTAAKLDGRDPQVQFWLSNVAAIEGDYVGRLQALRRAVALDPRLYRATGTAAMAAWELGHVREAELHAARLRDLDLSQSFFCSYALDFFRGHYADTVTNILAVRDRLTEADFADWKLGVAYLVLGQEQPARLLMRLPPHLWRVASGAGPAPGDLETILIEAEQDERAQFYALTALRQVLKAGRPGEIVAAYDRRVGVMAALVSGDVSNDVPITFGVQVAQALKAVGRTQEGAMLLARGDAAVRKSLSHGDMPNWMYAGAAGVWAAQGRTEDALSALETAVRRGWHYAPMTPMPDIADIPSFAGLRGNARFERLRRELRDHLSAERRKLGSAPV
jgi:tetratricopeptide (TPR) repeat protein